MDIELMRHCADLNINPQEDMDTFIYNSITSLDNPENEILQVIKESDKEQILFVIKHLLKYSTIFC